MVLGSTFFTDSFTIILPLRITPAIRLGLRSGLTVPV